MAKEKWNEFRMGMDRKLARGVHLPPRHGVAARRKVARRACDVVPHRLPASTLAGSLAVRHFGLLLALLVAVALGGAPPVVRAHDLSATDWPATYRALENLFPEAAPDRWRVLRARLDDRELRRLAIDLGTAELGGERDRTFYVAYARDGELVGVVTVVRPVGVARIGPMAVGVDTWGRIAGVQHLAATVATGFLEQFRGRTLTSSFVVNGADLQPSRALDSESKHVAAAVHEALIVTWLLLGRENAGPPGDGAARQAVAPLPNGSRAGV